MRLLSTVRALLLRRERIVPLIALLLAAAVPAPPHVAVAPFHGETGEACAERVAALLRRTATVDEELAPKLPTRGRFAALRRALARGTEAGVDIHVHGFLRNDSIIVEAFGGTPLRLLGVTKVRTAGRCGFTPKGRTAVLRWWSLVAARARGREPFAMAYRKAPPRAEPSPPVPVPTATLAVTSTVTR